MRPFIYTPLVLSIIFLSGMVYGQTNALLGIYGFGGENQDEADQYIFRTKDSGHIVRITSFHSPNHPPAGNITNCSGNRVIGNTMLFQKYDKTGQKVWEQCYAPDADTSAYYYFPDEATGNAYVIGLYNDHAAVRKLGLGKMDGTGKFLWMTGYYGWNTGKRIFKTACRAADGGFFLAFKSGDTDNLVTVHYGSTMWEDIFLLKIDSTGGIEWGKTIGGTGPDLVSKLLPAPDGGCYVVGSSNSFDYDGVGNHGEYDAFIARVDKTGAVRWSRCFGGSSDENINDACFNGNDKILLAGLARSADGDVSMNHGTNLTLDYWLVNMDTSGNLLWEKTYGGANNEFANAVSLGYDNSIWVTGTINTQTGQVYTAFGNGDSWTIRADNSGNLISSKVLGANKIDEGTALLPLPDGSVIMCGYYSGPGPSGGEFLDYFVPSTYPHGDIFVARLSQWTTSASDPKKAIIPCRIYPNPAEQLLYVELTEQPALPYRIELRNSEGKIVYHTTTPGGQTVSLPVDKYPKGSYLLTVRSGERLRTEKILLP